MRDGPLAGRRLEVRGKLEIGRQGTSGMLEDEQVSRHHAVVRVDGDDVVIEDLGSTNGTWVNRLRINRPVPLNHGDIVRVGTTTLAVELPAASPVPIDQPGPAIGHDRPPTDYPPWGWGPVGADGPTEPHGMPPRARRSMIGMAVIVVVVILTVVALVLLLGDK